MIRKITPFLWVLLIMCLGANISAQQNNVSFVADREGSVSNLTATRSNNAYQAILNNISEFDLYKLDANSIYKFVKQAPEIKEFSIRFGNEDIDFTIWENDVTTHNYKYAVSTQTGYERRMPGEVTTYAGYVNGDKNNKARLAIREDYIAGVFNRGNHEFSIQPSDAYLDTERKDQFVLYNTADLIKTEGVVCDASLKGRTQRLTDNIASSSGGAWVCTDITMAADQAFYNIHGGNTEAVLQEILNLVQVYYDQLEIQYKLTEVYVDEAGTAAWTSNRNISQIMPKYRSWSAGYWSNPYDATTLYTAVDIYGDDSGSGAGLIGRAYINALCGSNNFQICEYFRGWGNDNTKHRVNMSHELGHTWGSNHVSGCGSCIMSPTLDGLQNQWSTTGANSIKNGKSKSCLEAGQCSFKDPPKASFTANTTDGCESLSVQFTDNSANDPDSWLWEFGDGNTSTQQNPLYTYSSPGKYSVTLTATNEYGNDTETKTNLIDVGTGVPYTAISGAAPDTSMGGGGFNPTPRGLFFNAKEDIVIDKVTVYMQSTGQAVIEILNASQTSVFSKSVSLNAGKNEVALNAKVIQGNGYLIQTGNTPLYRNNAGVSFPYTVGNLVDITSTNATSDPVGFYYFFYDWKVRKAGCGTSTGIDEKHSELRIYPNPVNDEFHIELLETGTEAQPIDVKLYNLPGAVVYAKTFTTAGSKYRLNLESLVPGHYLLYIKTGDRVYNYKLLKE